MAVEPSDRNRVATQSPPRVDILGVRVSAVDIPTTLDTVAAWIGTDARQYICVTGVHGVMESQGDDDLRAIHNRSGLTVPDGVPLVWLGRLAGASGMRRVCGPDLTPELCRLAARHGWSSFFYGGGPGVAERLADELGRRFPGLKVAGTLTPPFRPLTEKEKEEVTELINKTSPDIVWVGLSTPKQERWMDDFRSRLDAPVLIGVGAVFDFFTGGIRRAPSWMQKTGLEWLFRLGQEPRRLWRRYLRNNPRFLLKVLGRPPRLVTPEPERGAFVVVVGPDGAGKTSVAEGILSRVRGRYFHFRPPLRRSSMPYAPPPQQPALDKRPEPGPVPLGWLRLGRNWLISWIGYLTAIRPSLRAGEVVIADRWLYGYLVQPRPLKFSGPAWLARLALASLPRPDVVLNLVTKPEIAAARKSELTVDEVRTELEAWQRLPFHQQVDLDADQSLAEVVAAALAFIDPRQRQ